jgi:ABC-2 type transport system permease protein
VTPHPQPLSRKGRGAEIIAATALFLRAMLARAYPRVVGMKRQPSWIVHETILPVLSVAAGREFVGYVILGGAMTAFWLNVLWSMGAQLYWERSGGNLELYIMAPCPMMAVLAGMALGGMTLTCVRAGVIFAAGILIFQIPFAPVSWPLLILVFFLMLLALYGLARPGTSSTCFRSRYTCSRARTSRCAFSAAWSPPERRCCR